MRILVLAALALSLPTAANALIPVTDAAYEDGSETVPAIVSTNAVDTASPWRAAGDARHSSVSVDYDEDGHPDQAQIVENGLQAGVELTSGMTGKRQMIWLIDTDGLADDVRLEVTKSGLLEVVFPESTGIILFQDDGAPMATYLNG